MQYTIAELPPAPDAPDELSHCWDVGEDGTVCGTQSTPGAFLNAVRWSGSVPTVLGASAIHGYGLNDLGEVVGETGQPHAYVWTAQGQVQDLASVLGGGPSTALDINNDGVVVGAVQAYALPRPFIYHSKGAGPPVILDPLPGDTYAIAISLNEAGDVVGISGTADWTKQAHAFVWRAATGLVEEVGAVWEIWALNASGVATGQKHFSGALISGGYQIGNAFRLATKSDPPLIENLGHSKVPGYAGSTGYDIHDAGVVVGYSMPDYAGGSTEGWRAFVDFPAEGFFDLQSLVVNDTGWKLSWATSINNSGVIVGSGVYQGSSRAFRLTPIAEDNFDWDVDLGKYLARFVMMFGGATKGGAGTGLTYGFKPVPIPPHEPLARAWRRLTPEQRDIAIAFAIKRLGSELSNAGAHELIERATSDIIERAVQQLEQQSDEES
jgi:uncharacterized membrane protein